MKKDPLIIVFILLTVWLGLSVVHLNQKKYPLAGRCALTFKSMIHDRLPMQNLCLPNALKYTPISVNQLLLLGYKLDVNYASESDLCAVPPIGAKLAAKIIKQREARAFRDLNDLQHIRGIGPATLRKIRPFLSCSLSDNSNYP